MPEQPGSEQIAIRDGKLCRAPPGTHLTSRAAEIIVASKFVRLSWFNAGLDVGRAALHLRVAGRPLGFARAVRS